MSALNVDHPWFASAERIHFPSTSAHAFTVQRSVLVSVHVALGHANPAAPDFGGVGGGATFQRRPAKVGGSVVLVSLPRSLNTFAVCIDQVSKMHPSSDTDFSVGGCGVFASSLLLFLSLFSNSSGRRLGDCNGSHHGQCEGHGGRIERPLVV